MAKRRKSGTGGVSLRKDGRWEGRYVVGYDDKGLPKTKNVLAKTKAECQAKLKALKAECDVTKPDDVASDMRFGERNGRRQSQKRRALGGALRRRLR